MTTHVVHLAVDEEQVLDTCASVNSLLELQRSLGALTESAADELTEFIKKKHLDVDIEGVLLKSGIIYITAEEEEAIKLVECGVVYRIDQH